MGHNCFICVLSLFILSSCTEVESDILQIQDEILKDSIFEVAEVDSLLVGEWINISTPSGIRIEKDGTLRYLKINQINGETEIDNRFTDKIMAKNGSFSHVENTNCFKNIFNDSIYSISNDTLSIPLDNGLNGGLRSFVRNDSIVLKMKKRPQSFMKASIKINNHIGETDVDFDASDPYENINGYFVNKSTIFISANDILSYNCRLSNSEYSEVNFIIDQQIDSLGTYPINWAYLRVSFYDAEFGNAYYLSYDADNFIAGNVTITKIEYFENQMLLEGNFELNFESTFQEVTYPKKLNNGSFKIYIRNYMPDDSP